MKSEAEVKDLLKMQKELHKIHKKECNVCKTNDECKTNIIYTDRMDVLKHILSLA